MNMLCVNLPFFNNGKIANKSVNRATNNVVTTPKFNTGVTSDVFIRTSPSFGSATSNGKFLMKLSRIRDPYSGATQKAIAFNDFYKKISKFIFGCKFGITAI